MYERNIGHISTRYRYMVLLADGQERHEFLTDTLDHPDLATLSIVPILNEMAEQGMAMDLKPDQAVRGTFAVVIHEETDPYCYEEIDVPFVESEIDYHASTMEGGG